MSYLYFSQQPVTSHSALVEEIGSGYRIDTAAMPSLHSCLQLILDNRTLIDYTLQGTSSKKTHQIKESQLVLFDSKLPGVKIVLANWIKQSKLEQLNSYDHYFGVSYHPEQGVQFTTQRIDQLIKMEEGHPVNYFSGPLLRALVDTYGEDAQVHFGHTTTSGKTSIGFSIDGISDQLGFFDISLEPPKGKGFTAL